MTLSHLLAFLFVLLIAIPAAATEYFISPNGSDDNPGTREAPWRSVDKANEVLQPGDTAVFLDGEYSGVINPARSGEGNAPITYRSESALGAVIKGGENPSGRALCVYLTSRDHIVIDGFHFLPTTGGWMRLEATNHCVVRNGRMENATRHGSPVECRDSHYNRYENLECWRSNNIGQWGHVAGDMWNNFGCSHCVFDRIHISRAGHRPFGQWFDSPYNVVRRCIFDCRWGRNFEFFSTPRLLVEGCVITNGFDGSGSADGRAKLFIIDSIFRRNVIYRNAYGPMVINAYKYEDLPTFGMMRSRVYHNTWYRNHEYGYEMVDLGREPAPHMVTGNLFKNNIFAYNDPGGDGLALFITSNIADDNRFERNILYGNEPGSKTVRYDWAWPSYTSWGGAHMTAEEANEARPAQFSGNMDAEPGFVDPDADDYRLGSESPAVDAAGPLAVALEDGSGREMRVDDARSFFDGFGIPGEVGDLVFIGAAKTQARVAKADIDANVLTFDHDVSWNAGDGVSLPYLGAAPDLGAYERGAETEDWYAAPIIPDGLRIETMETATEPVVVTDFEPENMEDWHYYWNFSRQRYTDSRMDDTTAFSGKHSMRVFATNDGADLSCDIRPRWWDIDRFPTVKVAYRIPQGVSVGIWLYCFRAAEWGQGAVCIAQSPAMDYDTAPHAGDTTLLDDDQWHEVTLDARVIRTLHPNVKLIQKLRFFALGSGKKDQHFWFDSFRILPADAG